MAQRGPPSLRRCQPPCVPFLGVFLTDLTMIEDGNPDMITHAVPLINFVKRRKVAEVIGAIQRYQSTPYNFEVVPVIRDYLIDASSRAMGESELYDASLVLEPRAPRPS